MLELGSHCSFQYFAEEREVGDWTIVVGSSGYEPGLLRVGMTATILKLDGTPPEARDAFMMFSTCLQKMGRQALTRLVGIRSRLMAEVLAHFFSWSASSGEKSDRQH